MSTIYRVATAEIAAGIAGTVAELAREYFGCGPADDAHRAHLRREIVGSVTDLLVAASAVTLREEAGEIPAHDVQLRARVCTAAIGIQYAKTLTEEFVKMFEAVVQELRAEARAV